MGRLVVLLLLSLSPSCWSSLDVTSTGFGSGSSVSVTVDGAVWLSEAEGISVTSARKDGVDYIKGDNLVREKVFYNSSNRSSIKSSKSSSTTTNSRSSNSNSSSNNKQQQPASIHDLKACGNVQKLSQFDFLICRTSCPKTPSPTKTALALSPAPNGSGEWTGTRSSPPHTGCTIAETWWPSHRNSLTRRYEVYSSFP